MAKLTKFKLVNIDNIDQLDTRHGNFHVNEITDEIAAKLYADKSRYVDLADQSHLRSKKVDQPSDSITEVKETSQAAAKTAKK